MARRPHDPAALVSRGKVQMKQSLESAKSVLMPCKVTEDSRFLGIIDPDTYRGFLHADWTWKTMQAHCRREMRDWHLLIWGTGMEHVWRIEVSFTPSKV